MTPMLVLLALACSTPAPAPAPAPEVAPAAPAPAPEGPYAGDDAALEAAKAAVRSLQVQLKARLTSVMEAEGPAAAAKVCAEEAQAMTKAVAEQHGAQVGRASLRLRDPADAGPSWVQAWLTTQGERKAEGILGTTEVVDTPEGRVARVLAPIVIAEPCLACHGPADSLAPGVREVLAERFPGDAATGYAVGDLRGAAWAEVAVAAAAPPTP